MDLKSLQKQLQQVQSKSSTFKLSERTVVEVLKKVINNRKLKINFTNNGREYVTNEKLQVEMQNLVKLNKGCISKLELSNQLDVQSNVFELQLNNFIISSSKSKNYLQIIEEKLVSVSYLNSMTEKINNLLEEHNGILEISELSFIFDFSSNFIKNFLTDKTNNKEIKANLFATRLLTDNYIELQKNKIRPILIASIQPISINTIVEEFKLDDNIVNDLIKSLIVDEGITLKTNSKGKPKKKEFNQLMLKDKIGIRGVLSNGIFEPLIYSKLQLEFLKGNLSQNSYIEFSKLLKIGIKDPKQYILTNIENSKEGIFLNDLFIDKSLKTRFETLFYDNFFSNKITNINSLFDIDLSEDDCVKILESIKFETKNEAEVVNKNIIPIKLINTFLDDLKSLINEEALHYYEEYMEKLREIDKKRKQFEDQLLKEKEKDEKKKGKKGNNSKKNKNTSLVDLEDELFFTNNKKSYNVQTISESFKETLMIEFKQKLLAIQSCSITNIDNNNKSKNQTLLLNNNLQDCDLNEPIDTLEFLLDNFIIPQVNNEYNKVLNNMVENKKKSYGKNKYDEEDDAVDINKKLANNFCELKFYSKSLNYIEKLSNNKTNINLSNSIKAFYTSFSKIQLNSLLKDILKKQFIHMKLKLDYNKLGSYNFRKELIENNLSGIDNEIANIMTQLNEYIQSKNINGFLSLIEKNIKILPFSINNLDKKKEKALELEFKNRLDDNSSKHDKVLWKSTQKMDLNEVIVDLCCKMVVENNNLYLPLPNETWSISVYLNLFEEMKKELNLNETGVSLIKSANEILSSKESEYEKRIEELYNIASKLKDNLTKL